MNILPVIIALIPGCIAFRSIIVDLKSNTKGE